MKTRSLAIVVIVVVIALLLGGCCHEPPFPRVAAQADLTVAQLLKKFDGRPPTVRSTVKSRAELTGDTKVVQLLREGELLARLSGVDLASPVEVLAWEGRCDGEMRQLVVVVFSQESGRILTLDEEPLLYARVYAGR
jgi:hypothetical protein